MLIQQMLKSWGITLPKENDEYLYFPEYLLQNYSTKCYFADFFPKTISNNYAEKHSQIESKIYNLVCDRMYNVILKLWVYDNIYFKSELLYNKKFSKIIIKKHIINNCIEKEKHLKFLMQLSKKNIIDLTLIFENLHMILIPSWSCFFVFVEDDSFLPFIKEAFISEGLYLRNNSVE